MIKGNLMSDLSCWLSEKADRKDYLLVKRLSANDTGATGGHQVGLYIPSAMVEKLFPSINITSVKNPDTKITAHVSSHDCPDSLARAIYYNNKYFGGTRNEKRITRWGRNSPLQDAENTGALAILAFQNNDGLDSNFVDIWVCRSLGEEDLVESVIGEVLPGVLLFGTSSKIISSSALGNISSRGTYIIPDDWKINFPSGRDIVMYANEHCASRSKNPDVQLLERRNYEYEIFLLIEQAHVLDLIKKGFGTVDEFIALANSVSNRRKSRAGRSLELHLEQLFIEHGLLTFSTQAVTEGNKKPDFLFPSSDAYHNLSFPSEKLNMLAVKTTCKDRWRQVLNEANRIEKIHLFTLQEGVSVTQFEEMQQAGVNLVVPLSLHKKYPEKIRGHLISLSDFINDLAKLYQEEVGA